MLNQQFDESHRAVFCCHPEPLYWTSPKSMFQEANLLDMDLHGKTWRGLRKAAHKSAQGFIQVKEKLPDTHVTLLRFLPETQLATSLYSRPKQPQRKSEMTPSTTSTTVIHVNQEQDQKRKQETGRIFQRTSYH